MNPVRSALMPPEVAQLREVLFEHGEPVGTVDPYEEIFRRCDGDPDGLDEFRAESEKLTRAVRLACFKKIVGFDARSMQEIADDLGVTRAAISRVFRIVMDGLGLAESHAKAVHRRHLAQARLDFVACSKAEEKARQAWVKHQECIRTGDTVGAAAAKTEFFRHSDRAAGLKAAARRRRTRS